MDSLLNLMTPEFLALALLIAVLSGFVKGVVGFGLPTILISALGSFLSPELALAGLLLPTLVTNIMQAFRQGAGAAWASLKKFRVYLLVGAVVMIASAQLVSIIPSSWLYIGIGVPVALFTSVQLMGWTPTIPSASRVAEVSVGAFAGFVGGLSGIWGPPTVMYLSAINTPKQEQMRIQGVVFGLGALLLFVTHLQSGVLRVETVPFSALLVLPSVLGIWLGFQVQDRIDQKRFRQITAWVLLLAGLNLIRRGLLG